MKTIIIEIMTTLFLMDCSLNKRVENNLNETENSYSIKVGFTGKSLARDVLKGLEGNLRFLEEKDIENYVETIIKSGRKETEETLTIFLRIMICSINNCF